MGRLGPPPRELPALDDAEGWKTYVTETDGFVRSMVGDATAGFKGSIEERDIGPCPLYVVTPDGVMSGDRRVFLDIHGGAWVLGGGDLCKRTTIALADDVHFRFGESILDPQRPEYQVPMFAYLAQLEGPQPLYDLRQAQSSLAGVDWDFASWGGLGVIATNTSEQNGLLGGFNSGSLAVAKNANTSSVGVSARVGFGDGWVTTFSYSEGITQLNLKSDALISSADTLHSRSYGFAVAKHGLFGDDDSLGLAVTRPLQIYSGGVNISAADGVDTNTGDLKIGHEYVALASNTPETDLELGYVTTFMDGAVALQANAGYQMNVAGLGGTNSLSVISRAKINF